MCDYIFVRIDTNNIRSMIYDVIYRQSNKQYKFNKYAVLIFIMVSNVYFP